MINLLWILLYKVFAFILLGVVLNHAVGKRGENAARVLIWIALYILIPAYIFLTMWANTLSLSYSWKIAACAFIVVIFGALLAWVWAAKRGISFKAHCLPVIFMNSAYLAIPVNTLLWGAQGAAYAIIYNITITLLNFTLGIWWASKEKPFAEIAGLPVIYAAAAGAALNVFGSGFPAALEKVNSLVSLVTLPVMLIFVGYRLGGIRTGNAGLVAWGVSLRMIGGLFAGVSAVYLLGITGPAAGVCVMTSSMPAAVYSFILTEKYGGNTAFAAASVFAGTLLSFFTIVLLGYIYG